MLKLMIVDDEYLIRQYIRNCIDWEEIGYTIVGEMESAQGHCVWLNRSSRMWC